jgi:hypothetical protein
MGNRDIKKEVKKKKKADTGSTGPSLKPMMPEPEIVKKTKKKSD